MCIPLGFYYLMPKARGTSTPHSCCFLRRKGISFHAQGEKGHRETAAFSLPLCFLLSVRIGLIYPTCELWQRNSACLALSLHFLSFQSCLCEEVPRRGPSAPRSTLNQTRSLRSCCRGSGASQWVHHPDLHLSPSSPPSCLLPSLLFSSHFRLFPPETSLTADPPASFFAEKTEVISRELP